MVNNLVFLQEHASGDVSYLREIIAIYVRTMPEYLEELKSYLNTQNWIEVSNQAHKMKSPAKLFGDSKLESLLNEIEYECKEDNVNLESTINKISQINDLLFTSIQELEDFLVEC